MLGSPPSPKETTALIKPKRSGASDARQRLPVCTLQPLTVIIPALVRGVFVWKSNFAGLKATLTRLRPAERRGKDRKGHNFRRGGRGGHRRGRWKRGPDLQRGHEDGRQGSR